MKQQATQTVLQTAKPSPIQVINLTDKVADEHPKCFFSND